MVASAHIAATDPLVTPCRLRCIMRHDSIFDFSAMYICIVCLFISYASHLSFSSLFHYLSPPLLIFSFENDPLCSVVVKGN